MTDVNLSKLDKLVDQAVEMARKKMNEETSLKNKEARFCAITWFLCQAIYIALIQAQIVILAYMKGMIDLLAC